MLEGKATKLTRKGGENGQTECPHTSSWRARKGTRSPPNLSAVGSGPEKGACLGRGSRAGSDLATQLMRHRLRSMVVPGVICVSASRECVVYPTKATSPCVGTYVIAASGNMRRRMTLDSPTDRIVPTLIGGTPSSASPTGAGDLPTGCASEPWQDA